jgi:nucleoside-diphosphate-sugar epimerase
MTARRPIADSVVLITGGRGFLGTNLSRRLRELGTEVHAISRSRVAEASDGIHWVQGDIADMKFVRDILSSVKPDVVFHLSGHGVGSPDVENVLPTLRDDLMTAVNLLVAVTEQKVGRLMLAASLEEPTAQNLDVPPATPYAAAKWASSTYARMFFELYRTPIVTTRPFMAYGPRQRPHKLIPHVILSLLQGQSPKLSSGQRPVDWVYVDDAIDGMIKAAGVSGIDGQSFDLGSGELISIRSVVERIAKIIGSSAQPQFGALPDRPMERVRVADLAPAAELLGWKPVTSIDEGLRKTIAWYQKESVKSASQTGA